MSGCGLPDVIDVIHGISAANELASLIPAWNCELAHCRSGLVPQLNQGSASAEPLLRACCTVLAVHLYDSRGGGEMGGRLRLGCPLHPLLASRYAVCYLQYTEPGRPYAHPISATFRTHLDKITQKDQHQGSCDNFFVFVFLGLLRYW